MQRRWWRQFRNCDAVRVAHFCSHECSRVWCLLEGTAITRGRYFQRLADVGAQCSQLDHLYHETRSCRKWFDFHAVGQSIGSEAELRKELHSLVTLETPSSPLKIQGLSFLDGVKHFAGP